MTSHDKGEFDVNPTVGNSPRGSWEIQRLAWATPDSTACNHRRPDVELIVDGKEYRAAPTQAEAK